MAAFSLESRLDGAVGGKTATALNRAFGMKTVGDLLAHYPRRYARRGELTPISSLPVGEPVTIVAEVRRANERKMMNRKGSLLEVIISDGQGELSLTFFNQSWRLKDLKAGRRGVFAGKVGEYRGAKQLAHPDYELFDDEETARLTAEANANLPIPIYPATSTVASWQLKTIVDLVLDGLGPVPDPLTDELRREHGLLDARTAIERIHRPDFEDQIGPARDTLRMHEAFVL
ncbi:MAG TPA: OB-fold nucleic acid binding domain-containing protein, partial [Microbacterium sp.]|nr:OB-fold nucleic acid binding domain-containing protein [Microbacterium sp.]